MGDKHFDRGHDSNVGVGPLCQGPGHRNVRSTPSVLVHLYFVRPHVSGECRLHSSPTLLSEMEGRRISGCRPSPPSTREAFEVLSKEGPGRSTASGVRQESLTGVGVLETEAVGPE